MKLKELGVQNPEGETGGGVVRVEGGGERRPKRAEKRETEDKSLGKPC